MSFGLVKDGESFGEYNVMVFTYHTKIRMKFTSLIKAVLKLWYILRGKHMYSEQISKV